MSSIPLKLEGIPESEWSPEFIQGMLNRMAVSFHKYGKVMDSPSTLDHIEGLKKRLSKYEEDHNLEWLMDVANFAMIEYMKPSREGAWFRATTSDESPGLVTKDGRTTYKNHKPQFHPYDRTGD